MRDSNGSQQCSSRRAWFDVFIMFSSSNKTCCSTVLNSLKFFHFLFWNTIKGTVAVVHTFYYNSIDKQFDFFVSGAFADAPYGPQ